MRWIPLHWLWVCLCCSLLLVAVSCSTPKEATSSLDLPQVRVVAALQTSIPEFYDYVGQTDAPTNIEIRARVEGFIQQILFQEGAEVEQNQLLFVIDPQTYQENLADAQAKLADAMARYSRTQKDVDRLTPLVKIQAVAQRDFDDAVAANESALANVNAAKTVVANAEINLSYTQVRSPIQGKIGATAVRVGTLVGRGEPTLLATISSLNPVWVSFNISEKDYLMYTRRYLEAEDKTKVPAPRFQLLLADNTPWPYPGTMNFVDRAVDSTTGTLKVRVEFPNPQKLLKPGLFARVRATVREIPNAILVPQKAIHELQNLKMVWVVDSNQQAHTRQVQVGNPIGNSIVIQSGLQAGEQVIVEGIQKVRDNLKVKAELLPYTAEDILKNLNQEPPTPPN